MAYGDLKDLAKRTASDKLLRDKAFNIDKNPRYDGYQRNLSSMVYSFFDKKSPGSGVAMLQNQQLAEELHKTIIRKLEKRRVYSSFKDNIWGADLTYMQLITNFIKGFRFLLCIIFLIIIFNILRFLLRIIDIFSKYTWVVPLKILDDSKRKRNKIWVDEGSEFYNNSFKKWL